MEEFQWPHGAENVIRVASKGGEGLLHFQNRGAEAVSRGQDLDAAGLSL